MADTISPKELAASMGINPKALRRFMRAVADKQTSETGEARVQRVGQGNRYDLSSADARYIRKLWAEAHAKARPSSKEIEAKAGDVIPPIA